jgi:hypothetical protein
MAAADSRAHAEIPCERDAFAEAGAAIGPLRDPDGCVLACPDCTCRRLLDERRSEHARAASPARKPLPTGEPPAASGDFQLL